LENVMFTYLRHLIVEGAWGSVVVKVLRY
jgi:hypothetical protein